MTYTGFYLQEMLGESRSLTCTLLDTLGNISLAPHTMREVLNTVLKRLDRVDVCDLPSVVEYVLTSLNDVEDVNAILMVGL